MTNLDFQAAIFDLDGTLLDSMHVWNDIDVAFLKKRGISPVPEDYCKALAPLSFRETAEYTIQRFQLTDTPEGLMQEWNQMALDAYSHDIKLKPGAKAYLQYLREQEIRLGVCTTLSKKLYVPCLRNLGILDWFDVLVATDEVNKGKSYPEPYLYTAMKLGVRPKDCLVFEDIPAGISGALKAGMRVCGVYDDREKEHIALIKKTADYYIFTFEELLPTP